MNEIFALAIKDLRLMARDRVGMIFAFGLPLIYASFFGTIFSGEGSAGTSSIKIAVVDEDA
ncbi:MAG: ABC transporter permease, partial [Planctomycetes bacterium]|nr:ABC transporter permease [Planctomycetota bacterium]